MDGYIVALCLVLWIELNCIQLCSTLRFCDSNCFVNLKRYKKLDDHCSNIDERSEQVKKIRCNISINITDTFDCTTGSFGIQYFIPENKELSHKTAEISFFRCDAPKTCKTETPPNKPLGELKGSYTVDLHKFINNFIPDPNAGYQLNVWQKEKSPEKIIQTFYYVTFHNCTLLSEFKLPDYFENILIILLVTLSLLLIVMVVVYKQRAALLPLCCGRSIGTYSDQNRIIILPLAKYSVKIYIAFIDDNEKHRNVILKFATFLEGDLGFDVKLHLYNRDEVFADPDLWLDKTLSVCDKVIVIWSPGARERWNQKEHKENISDLFTPVLRTIKRDLLHDRNVNKYYFGYFEYCSVDVVPDAFRNTTFRHFELMTEFKNFYYKLIDEDHLNNLEKVVVDEIVSADSYFDSEITKYGSALETSIREMNDYVENSPDY